MQMKYNSPSKLDSAPLAISHFISREYHYVPSLLNFLLGAWKKSER